MINSANTAHHTALFVRCSAGVVPQEEGQSVMTHSSLGFEAIFTGGSCHSVDAQATPVFKTSFPAAVENRSHNNLPLPYCTQPSKGSTCHRSSRSFCCRKRDQTAISPHPTVYTRREHNRFHSVHACDCSHLLLFHC